MKKKYQLIILLALGIFFNSCEKIMFDKDVSSTDPYTNFDYLWEQCDTKYSYFDVKNIDWYKVKTEYRAKLHDEMSREELFDVLGSMLKELRDDHTNLSSFFNISIYGVDYQHRDNYEWRVIKDNYLSDSLMYTGSFVSDFLDNGKIGYMRYPKFTGEIYEDGEHNLDYILDRFKGTKGIIVDLRENGGGASVDVFALLSCFIDTKTLIYYSRIKNGPAHNDFSEAEPVYIEPNNVIRYLKKTVFLVDRGTFSAASFTSLSTKAIPNIVLMGDTTGGGLGMPNGGQLPNGWTYRFSITQALNLDKSPDWENGIPPDIYVEFDWNNLTKDEILEKAIQELQ